MEHRSLAVTFPSPSPQLPRSQAQRPQSPTGLPSSVIGFVTAAGCGFRSMP